MRLRWIPTLVAAVMIAIGVSAGLWQTRRAEQKIAFKASIEAAREQPPVALAGQAFDAQALRWRTVDVQGTWLAESTFFLDNRMHQGVPGYHVITPVKLADGRVVLVNRGWLAGGRDRAQLPHAPAPRQPAQITGQVRVPLEHAFALGPIASADHRVWQQLNLEAIGPALQLTLAPFVVFQQSGAEDGLVRVWESPDYGIDMHRGYAFQWFALAVLAAVFYLALCIRDARHEN